MIMRVDMTTRCVGVYLGWDMGGGQGKWIWGYAYTGHGIGRLDRSLYRGASKAWRLILCVGVLAQMGG